MVNSEDQGEVVRAGGRKEITNTGTNVAVNKIEKVLQAADIKNYMLCIYYPISSYFPVKIIHGIVCKLRFPNYRVQVFC